VTHVLPAVVVATVIIGTNVSFSLFVEVLSVDCNSTDVLGCRHLRCRTGRRGRTTVLCATDRQLALPSLMRLQTTDQSPVTGSRRTSFSGSCCGLAYVPVGGVFLAFLEDPLLWAGLHRDVNSLKNTITFTM